jgi:hypothetical protein
MIPPPLFIYKVRFISRQEVYTAHDPDGFVQDVHEVMLVTASSSNKVIQAIVGAFPKARQIETEKVGEA